MRHMLKRTLVAVAIATAIGGLAAPTVAAADETVPIGPSSLLPFDQRPDPARFVGHGSAKKPGPALTQARKQAQTRATNAGYWDCEETFEDVAPVPEGPPVPFDATYGATVELTCHPNPSV